MGFVPIRRCTALLCVLALACEDDPAPSGRDVGNRVRTDASPIDVGATPLDAGIIEDTGVTPDTGMPQDAEFRDTEPDAMVAPDADGPNRPDGDMLDATPTDATAPDASVPDAEPMDALPIDTGVPPVPDMDNDTISDADEGNNVIDVDADGTPDASDTDSDGDGIPDSVEAGDADVTTPPVDSDNDGTPDFRDRDSDGDSVFDALEGTGDPDGDMIPNYLDTDSDGDGIDDAIEGGGDTDNDGIPNFLDLDSDGDTLPDMIEGSQDVDNDTLPNFLDTDSDGDGIGDMIELQVDPDQDMIPAYLDTDSDGDGIDDMIEGLIDADNDGFGNYLDRDSDGDTIGDDAETAADRDGDGIPNFLDLDSDGDTLSDADEAGDSNPVTPPRNVDFDQEPDFLDTDSDNDRIGDLHEGLGDFDMDGIPDRHDIDTDNDSILDDVESGDTSTITPPVNTDMDAQPDFRDLDSDNDTILDISEGTNDPDVDMIPNFRDTDSDGDTWLDAVEAGDTSTATPPVNSDNDNTPDFLDLDSDADGLGDVSEPGCPAGPERTNPDSDNDSFPDPAEIAVQSDPCDPASVIDDFFFVLPPGGPGDDAPLVFNNTNIDRADMAINVDTTGSMGGEIQNLRNSLSGTIINGVSQAVPDVAVAVTSFEDYPVDSFGNPVRGDIPFRLGTRVTTDIGAAQLAVNNLVTRDGLDQPESGVEALYQIATGAGTSWPGGSVPAFDPNAGRVVGVSDGTIGGVGFRDDALPIVVHVTDAPAHNRAQYVAQNTGINSADTPAVETALGSIGARIVTISNPRMSALPSDPFTPICDKSQGTMFGVIGDPVGSDTDWFRLNGVAAGDVVVIETNTYRQGSNLDTHVGIYNATNVLAANDDFDFPTHFDSRATATLSGLPPYYVAISSFGDPDHNGTGAETSGWYFATITVNGVPWTTNPVGCRTADDANNRIGATQLVTFNAAAAPASVANCASACAPNIPNLTLPQLMSLSTRAVIPPCAWDAFGAGRPATCGATQCCTGLNGAGVAPTGPNGTCPLTFQIQDDGAGLDQAVVTGIQALVNFANFTITTVVRPDPAEMAASGLDTTCFIHGVIPTTATPPNACAPQPTPVDLVPPMPELDGWENVVPGTVLEFQVNALNEDRATNTPCVGSTADPQLFRAFIDVVADGVTVVDTRDVVIIVPPRPPGGTN